MSGVARGEGFKEKVVQNMRRKKRPEAAMGGPWSKYYPQMISKIALHT